MTNASLIAILYLVYGLPLSFSFLAQSLNANIHRSANDCHYGILCSTSSSEQDDGTFISAIEHFLSVCSNCNEMIPYSVRIVSRQSSHDPPNVMVKESVFYCDESSDIYITLTSNSDGVDKAKLQLAIGQELTMATPKEVKSLLGVPSDAVPPFGHTATAHTTIIVDESLVDQCKTSNTRIVGNAVHPLWQCLVTCDALLTLPNVKVADICGVNQDVETELEDACSSTEKRTGASTSDSPKPPELSFPGHFPGSVPPTNIAKLVVEQRSLSNPLLPTTIKAIGSLGEVEKKTKKLVTANFHPLDNDETMTEEPLEWRLRLDGEPVTIQLIFGRLLFQLLGKSQWDAILDTLESDQVIEITAQTRVIDRDSLSKWVQDRCLELEVREFRILSSDSASDTAEMPFKHKPKSEWTSPQFLPITMQDIFGPAGRIEFVDSIESLQAFETEVAKLLSNEARANNLMGIDCEWQPNQLSASGEKQPVLLLQISLHALQKVYLLDLQTLLRPLLSPNEPMNEMEAQVSQVLRKLFGSNSMLKVGYQVSSDLLRVAASYPHVDCFQKVSSVLELDALVKRTLQLQKQKKSRAITTSLGRLTAHYLQKSICKDCQVSHWSARPLLKPQLDYAAIDAAIGPMLVLKAMDSMNATVNPDIPRIERWEGDEGLDKIIVHWRFTHFDADPEIVKFKATQVYGLCWTVSQNWIVGKPEPPIPTIS